jgi:hypothetical protein
MPDPGDGQVAEDGGVAAVRPPGQPPHGAALGRLDFRPEVAASMLDDEGRQQGVAQAGQWPERFPFHGVDPQAGLGGLPDELARGVEPVSGLEGGLLGGDDHGEVP